MKIVENKTTLQELKEMAKRKFGNLVKAVVDVEKGIMAIDGDLHADEEALLIQQGSKQENLWGINIYPESKGIDLIEFDSVINLRPSQGNRTREIDDPKTRRKIVDTINKLISK